MQRLAESTALVLCRIIATEVRVEHGQRRIWELSTSELTGFFEEIRAPFYVIGVDGYILWLNRAGYEIFGYLNEEMLNHRLEDVSGARNINISLHPTYFLLYVLMTSVLSRSTRYWDVHGNDFRW